MSDGGLRAADCGGGALRPAEPQLRSPRPAVVPTPSAQRGGLANMALSAFWFSVMALCVKLGGRRLPSQELVLVRAVLTLGMSWAALRSAGLAVRSPDPGRQRALLWRGALGCVGL